MGTLTEKSYRIDKVPVRGGMLAVGVWEPEGSDDATPTMVMLHGIAGTHLSFGALATMLPRTRIIAPDLRGRGASNQLLGPFGMLAHVEDVDAVMQVYAVRDAVVVGYSMGALVALVLAHHYPDRVQSLLLIDGGLPQVPDSAEKREEVARSLVDPVLRRRGQVFSSAHEYHGIAVATGCFPLPLNEHVTAVLNSQVEPVGGGVALRVSPRAIEDDAAKIAGAAEILASLNGLTRPAHLLWNRDATVVGLVRGLAPATIRDWVEVIPLLTAQEYPATGFSPLFCDQLSRMIADRLATLV